MALQTALDALETPGNQQINWLIGELLRLRANRDDWRECPILQHLETGAPNLNGWNELFRRTRISLADDTDFPRKARTLLRPDFLQRLQERHFLSVRQALEAIIRQS